MMLVRIYKYKYKYKKYEQLLKYGSGHLGSPNPFMKGDTLTFFHHIYRVSHDIGHLKIWLSPWPFLKSGT